MERGIKVSFIQNESCCSRSKTKSIPASSAKAVRPIRPLCFSAVVVAISTRTTTISPSVLVMLTVDLREASGPVVGGALASDGDSDGDSLSCSPQPTTRSSEANKTTRTAIEVLISDEFYPSFQNELYSFVLATLALVTRDPQSPDLSGVSDMGAAIGLSVYAFDLYDTHHPHPLWDKVDLCPDEIRVLKRFFAGKLIDPHAASLGEGLVCQALYLIDDVGRPRARERKVHPGAVNAHLAAGHLRLEVLPDHTGQDVQGGVIAHMSIAPLPVEFSVKLPDGAGDGSVEDVNYVTSLAPDVYNSSPDRTDAKSTPVCRLTSAAGVEGGPVKDHLPTGVSDHPGGKLLQVGIFEEKLFGHSASVPRSRSLKVTTSR